MQTDDTDDLLCFSVKRPIESTHITRCALKQTADNECKSLGKLGSVIHKP